MYKIIGSDSKEYGPVTLEQLHAWLAEGRVNAQTRVQAEGSTDWKPLAEFPELAGAAPAVPPPLPAAQPRPVIPNYLVQSILCTLFCCLPFGIPAIVFAAQVNSKLAAGDVAGATASSNKARTWCWISFGCGVAISLIYAVVIGLGVARHRIH